MKLYRHYRQMWWWAGYTQRPWALFIFWWVRENGIYVLQDSRKKGKVSGNLMQKKNVWTWSTKLVDFSCISEVIQRVRPTETHYLPANIFVTSGSYRVCFVCVLGSSPPSLPVYVIYLCYLYSYYIHF